MKESTMMDFLTVSQLNQLIQGVLQMGFPSPVWVCGEIQGYDRARSKKHVFFEMCEKDPVTHDIMARAGLVIFSGRRAYLDKVLSDNGSPFDLKDDIEVKFLCRVDFYPPHGAVRLIVEDIDPAYTLGKIAQEKYRLIARLQKEGVLERNKALLFPDVPLSIALITSYDSAAYHDFIAELRVSGFGFRVVYRHAQMQGRGAEDDICAALAESQDVPGVDVIVITRGGGSLADLSCFDSEKIARAVAANRLPVLSGIGHEINLTVTDMAAYAHQKTPTAVARFLIERVQEARDALEGSLLEVTARASEKIRGHREGLRKHAVAAQSATGAFLKGHDRMLAALMARLVQAPCGMLASKAQDVARLAEACEKGAIGAVDRERGRLGHAEKIMQMADPVRILRRGFSITRLRGGGILQSCSQAQKGDVLVTEVRDGACVSIVEEIDQGGVHG